MKTLNSNFQTALTQETTTLAWCWLIQRIDGINLGFTSFDLPLAIDGVNYAPETGFTPSAVNTSEGTERGDNQNLKSILSSDAITEGDLLAGKYNYASITCFIVDVTNLPASLTENPPKLLHLYTGILGKIKKSDRTFEIEVRGLDHKLENKLGELTSKFCRYEFGGFGCGVDLSPYTYSQGITGVSNQYTFAIDGSIPSGVLDRGKLTFTSGANNTISADIAYYSSNQIVLFQPLPYTIEVGDTVTVIQGCAKTLLACAKYNNVINFGGEPHVPLTDKALNMPTKTVKEGTIFGISIRQEDGETTHVNGEPIN